MIHETIRSEPSSSLASATAASIASILAGSGKCVRPLGEHLKRIQLEIVFGRWHHLRRRANGGEDLPGLECLAAEATTGLQSRSNLGSASWRWLCRLKRPSGEKAGIFASAFQRVAMPQNLPFVDLAVLPAGVSAPRSDAGNAAIRFEGDVGCVTKGAAIMWQLRRWLGGISAERLVRPEMAITVGRQAQSSTHSGQLREQGPTSVPGSRDRGRRDQGDDGPVRRVEFGHQVAPASGPRGRLALCRRAARLAAQPVPAAARKVSARARWTGSKSR